MRVLKDKYFVFFSLLTACISSVPAAKPQVPSQVAKKLKIYISVDMEGVAGVVTADQLGPGDSNTNDSGIS